MDKPNAVRRWANSHARRNQRFQGRGARLTGVEQANSIKGILA